MSKMPTPIATLSDIDTDIELLERFLALKEDIGNDHPRAVDVWKQSVVRKVEDLCDDVDTLAHKSDLDHIEVVEKLIVVNQKVKANVTLEYNRISETIE
ncbi:MAG: hypothetical protein Q9195_006447, partial [Heterodermia aff. obscurata]